MINKYRWRPDVKSTPCRYRCPWHHGPRDSEYIFRFRYKIAKEYARQANNLYE